MPRTQISCPNCRQPVIAEVNQLFDVGAEPAYKQLFLSGMVNLVQCTNCGYRGALATPIVYHDPQKELLLTFVPPELGLPRDGQERLLGSLINQVVNRLPTEQRKGYLLRPQAFLTLQSLVERVLEADGITREMIQEQQKRLNLVQRLLATDQPEARRELLKAEESLIDGQFFAIFGRLSEIAQASGDQEGARTLETLSAELLEQTEVGRQIKSQTAELEAAVRSLQEAGKELTREKLLDIVLKAPTEARLSALVSLARPGMDYQFFQMLSERIDRAREKGRQRMIELREKLLEFTAQFDAQLAERRQAARQLLARLLQVENVREATVQLLPNIDNFFVAELNDEMERVRGSGDLLAKASAERLGKLQEISAVLQEASAPPPEVALIEELMDIESEDERRRWLEEHRAEITPDFISFLTNIAAQAEQSGQEKEVIASLKAISRQVRRFSMETSLKG